jgi:hypothetical protein
MSWPSTGIRQRQLDLRNTRDALGRAAAVDDDEVERCLARYLALRSAGYIEAVRDDACDTFCEARSAPEVTSRIRVHLRTGQGTTPSQLVQFFGSFRAEWADELNALLDADDAVLRSRLGALVAARKKIAHGDGESVTTMRALQWAEAAELVGKWIVARFDPARTVSSPVQ